MAKFTHVKSAQKDIYHNGKRVEYVSKKGKRSGQTLSKIDRTIPQDENDTVFIKKGESYYWWQFKNGPKQLSKTEPKPSQLTQSNYLSQLYELQERVDDFYPDDKEEVESFIEELKSDIETLRDETQESLDAMPESLQSGPTGELLQERVDKLDEVINELESIDLDFDEDDVDEIKQEIADEDDIDTDENGWEDKIDENKLTERKADKLREWLDEVTEEIQQISFE